MIEYEATSGVGKPLSMHESDPSCPSERLFKGTRSDWTGQFQVLKVQALFVARTQH